MRRSASSFKSHDEGVSAAARLVLAVCVWLMAAPMASQAQRPDTVQLKNDVPLTYVVKRGDTLWDISGIYLEEPWRWPELWDSNPQIDNPHLIYPGDVLSLRWEDGRPRLGLASRGDVKLSPTVRSESLDTAIPPIPRDQIDPFLRANRVLDPGVMGSLAYVIAGDAKRIISGLGDRIYVRGPIDPDDRAFGIIREGSLIVDPITQEVLGVTAIDIGSDGGDPHRRSPDSAGGGHSRCLFPAQGPQCSGGERFHGGGFVRGDPDWPDEHCHHQSRRARGSRLG